MVTVHRFRREDFLHLLMLAALLCICPAALADNPPAPGAAEEAEANQVVKLIDQLGSDDFGTREKRKASWLRQDWKLTTRSTPRRATTIRKSRCGPATSCGA
jgi:hypothetical protein